MLALILSDIHANLEALQAVLTAAESIKFDELWNLGDLVGYGASPNQVIDLIRPLQTHVVRGNHDRVCCGLTSPTTFNPVARTAALWTRAELTPANIEWLREIPQGPLRPAEETVTLSHGSPLDEDTYILNMRDAWAPLQQMPSPVTFFGHTHIQGGFSQRDNIWQVLHPRLEPTSESDAATWTLELPPGTRHLINPGSVGQPRDRDWRAAFATFDSDARTITFHRVPYALAAAQARIAAAGLPARLAARLREGR